jgi:hypothetical protein
MEEKLENVMERSLRNGNSALERRGNRTIAWTHPFMLCCILPMEDAKSSLSGADVPCTLVLLVGYHVCNAEACVPVSVEGPLTEGTTPIGMTVFEEYSLCHRSVRRPPNYLTGVLEATEGQRLLLH